MNKPTPDTDALIERQKSLDLRLPEGVSWTSKANCLLREIAKALSEAHSRIDEMKERLREWMADDAEDKTLTIWWGKRTVHDLLTIIDSTDA